MKVLILNQAFYPDVVATAQIAADLAAELARQGNQVTVIAGRRAYDNPVEEFAAREQWAGVDVRRVWYPALGKRSRWRRALNFAGFFGSCLLALLRLPAQDVVIGMTTPPLISLLGAWFARWRGARFLFWGMDLNPDEAVAAGWLREDSLTCRALRKMLRYSLDRAEKVVVLDQYMAARIAGQGVEPEKIHIIPPWSQDPLVAYDPEAGASFRRQHGLEDKFVVMYSGNHSPCHPLDTLLESAARLSGRPDIAFCFVGGGSEFERVGRFAAEHKLDGVTCLPYQPLAGLSASLSAADLHVVVMGDPFVGIVHTSKIYNILSLGLPFLYIGPPRSHIADLVAGSKMNGNARLARHGDVDATVRHILAARARAGGPSQAEADLAVRFSRRLLVSRMIGLLEQWPGKTVASSQWSVASGEGTMVRGKASVARGAHAAD
jgi:glycosyltransferase involved in cell wall biosynthesis